MARGKAPMSEFIIRNNRKKITRSFCVILCFFILAGGFFYWPRQAVFSSSDELKESLRQQMNELQQQIDAYRASIKGIQQQGKSLSREISLLDNKIKSANLEIRRTNLAIRQAENDLADKNVAIGQAELKLEREREILGEYIRIIYEVGQQDFWEVIFKTGKLSEIFDEIAAYDNIQKNIQVSMSQIRDLHVSLEGDKQGLEERREDFNQLKVLQELQKMALAGEEQDKKNLLAQTKGQESTYQKLLTKASADAAAIRQNLYLLEGVGLSMSLEQAYYHAKRAGDLTGIRPAFLLAILKKESSWGQKVGTGTWRKDMRPADQQAFIEICEKLGRDPDKTPVSRKPSYGWGGAMGPAQFLPSTWLAYEEKIANLTGHWPPDPWDIGDAFVAAAIKLTQNGAVAGNENSEWKAAQIYFAGRNWNNPSYYFYGDQVMEFAAVIQEQLNLISR
ncbi:MAG: Peptidase M23 [Parcubacteria group bacterium GW2011_GWF2_44_7]|nr:MAG: Peptidase M23 [Parcubacteria group bacterium GW2011_GWF2_44_7]